MRKKVYIHNCGCQRRGLDGSRLVSYFTLNGCEVVNDPAEAQMNILLTCGFYLPRVESSIETLRELNKSKGELFVLGCLPGCDPLSLAKEFNGKSLAPMNYDSIDNLFPDLKIKFNEIKESNFIIENQGMLLGAIKKKEKQKKHEPLFTTIRQLFNQIIRFINEFELRKRFFSRCIDVLLKKNTYLRIANGCMGNCSYCVIRKATGKLRSKSPEILLDEYGELIKKGHRYFRLIGEDTGAYGVDIGTTLPALLYAMIKHGKTKDVAFAISTLNPQWLIAYKDEFLDLVKNGMLKSLEIDIQSASSSILNCMNRNYDIEQLEQIILELKKTNPKLFISVQFIVGFPSETEKDFQMTVDFLKKVKISSHQVFKYSDMDGTESALIKDKVSEEVKEERYKKLSLKYK